jgi:hypothetical protein
MFENGIPGSGSWCFVSDESSKEDHIEIFGSKGTIKFSVFTFEPIELRNESGTRSFNIPNPTYVQLPLIGNIVEHLLQKGNCACNSVSATPTNWVLDKILGKII